jgi:hypothetical protein
MPRLRTSQKHIHASSTSQPAVLGPPGAHMMLVARNRTVLVLAVVTAALTLASAQTGQNCVFNNTMCTCLFATTDGDCWNPIANTPGFCAKRLCDASWTCDCNGDYFCLRGPRSITLVSRADAGQTTAACRTVNNEIRITRAGLKLGYFHPVLSRRGYDAGQCEVRISSRLCSLCEGSVGCMWAYF